MASKRPAPVPDEATKPFWRGAQRGNLMIQKCSSCGNYYHPPEPFCLKCLSEDLVFVQVSGYGRIRGYSEVRAGARHGFFKDAVPYIIASIELTEQADLILYSNIRGAKLADVSVGAEVKAIFESASDGMTIPEFKLVDETIVGRPE
jgi:uncharacterized OB-fold protein